MRDEKVPNRVATRTVGYCTVGAPYIITLSVASWWGEAFPTRRKSPRKTGVMSICHIFPASHDFIVDLSNSIREFSFFSALHRVRILDY